MNILFLGTYLPTKYENRFKTLSAAGNQYQNNLVKALKKDNKVFSICHCGLPEVRLDTKERQELQKEGIETCLPKIDGYYSFFKYRNLIKKYSKDVDCVITYNVIYLWFGLRKIIKNKSCKLILVLADYTPPQEEKRWRKVYSWIMGKQFAKYDKLVLLSEKSKSFVKDKNKCIVVNGCLDWNMFKDISIKQMNNECVIAYTGFISKVTGIELLINSFQKIKDKDCRLILSGQIDNSEIEFLEKSCKDDSRIEYWGYVKKEKYLELLQMSDILVNPRDMSFSQNQYNFPSKIMEYLASGRIVISTKFAGYETYKDYILFSDSNPIDLAENIEYCINNKNKLLNETYNKNRLFIQQFTWENQVNNFCNN